MAGIGDIRRATSGASTSIKDFQRALAAVKAIKVRETQKAGREASRQIFTRFAAQLFADDKGVVRNLGRYGKRWGARKRALKLRMERGQARRGIFKQIRSPLIYAKLADGFDIDIKRPALWVTGRARIGKRKTVHIRNAGKGGYRHRLAVSNSESFFVNAYIDHYADQKAKGLGLLANEDIAEIEQRANAAVAGHLAAIRGAAKQALSKRAQATLRINVGRAA